MVAGGLKLERDEPHHASSHEQEYPLHLALSASGSFRHVSPWTERSLRRRLNFT
jgi:hypothetical protein